ncbi:MAG: GNAT family N-acetyltransferase [Actinomycetota bacterium]|nr:GNAT family N-acetyltransferase [Actinomycetota bacterium]
MSITLETVEDLASARRGWDELAAASGNVFATWDWMDAWWRSFGGGRRRLMLRRVLDADGRLLAMLPLYRTAHGPIAIARFLGHGPADELGPVCADADRAAAAEALTSMANELGTGGVLVAERLAGDAGWPPSLLRAPMRTEASPVVRTENCTWDEWLDSRSSNFRQQVRRRERRLVREHGLTFRLSDDPARLETDLDTLVRLHAARWGEESSTFTLGRLAFHREFAQRALAAGRLRLWLAEVDERPIAAWYGFRFARREVYYQAGRDPAWEREAVGFVLLAHTIRAAFQDGMREYRFGLGDEDYKTRFASDDPGLLTVAVGSRTATVLAGVAAAAARRLPRGARRAGLQRVA